MHTKRLIVPKFWAKDRKAKIWAMTTSPGPHKKFRSIPLGMLLRDVLKVATNAREAKKILGNGLVKVDGRIRKNKNYGVGLMDTFQVGDKTYRIVPTNKGLEAIEIPSKEVNMKILKVVNKSMIGKKNQLNFHDGKNILYDKKDIKVGDSILVSLPDLKIQKHMPLKKDVDVMIISGRHSGTVAKFKERKAILMAPDAAILEKGKDTFETTFDYLMVIGEVKTSK
jgi:small subunit ribosomal protein S4e